MWVTPGNGRPLSTEWEVTIVSSFDKASKSSVCANKFLDRREAFLLVRAQGGRGSAFRNFAHSSIKHLDIFKGHGEPPTGERCRGMGCIANQCDSPLS